MNIDGSKILVFNRGRRKENIQLRFDDRLIKVVPNINYLGVTLRRSGSFKIAIQKLSKNATKAMYEVLKKEECSTYQYSVNLIYLRKLLSQYLI